MTNARHQHGKYDYKNKYTCLHITAFF
jgi:hypothetical protein